MPLLAFLSVVLGAVLATLGGFVATQVGVSMERRRRGRGAALLCGEVLAAIGVLLRNAEETALQGSLLDPLPSRFLRAARRELDVYDRNRELLFSIDNATLRARLHSFMVRLSIPLDRLIDDQARYLDLRAAAGTAPDRLSEIKAVMETSFQFLRESRQLIPGLLSLLRPLARNSFDTYAGIGLRGVPEG